MSLNRYMFMSIVCYLVAMGAACNYTEPGTCALGQGGGGPTIGQGGGVVLPPQGGLGDDVDPQGAGDQADPCNAAEGSLYYCNGDVLCEYDVGTGGCHYVNSKKSTGSEGEAIAYFTAQCQSLNKDASCHPYKMTCSTKPAAKTSAAPTYLCNGGINCEDEKGNLDTCTYGLPAGQPPELVWAEDDEDARWFLAENCEVIMADFYGDNCANGGMCCTPGSLTCNKK